MYIILIIPFPLGIYHGLKDHNENVLHTITPWYGYYRGLEFFWHSYEEDIIDDSKVFISLYKKTAGAQNDPVDVENIKTLKARIDKYSNKNRAKIILNVKTYFMYIEAYKISFLTYLAMSNTEYFDDQMVVSEKVLSLEKILVKAGLNAETEITNKEFKMVSSMTYEKIKSSKNKPDFGAAFNEFKEANKLENLYAENLFKEVFNESIDISSLNSPKEKQL